MTHPVLSLWGAAPSLLIMFPHLTHVPTSLSGVPSPLQGYHPQWTCLFTVDNSAMLGRDQVSRKCVGIKWELGEHGSTVYSQSHLHPFQASFPTGHLQHRSFSKAAHEQTGKTTERRAGNNLEIPNSQTMAGMISHPNSFLCKYLWLSGRTAEAAGQGSERN